MSDDDRYALRFGDDADEGLLRHLSHYYFYPAIEVASIADADVVVEFRIDVNPGRSAHDEVVVGRTRLVRRTP